jgi:RNA polymerase-binding transcription factor DksA
MEKDTKHYKELLAVEKANLEKELATVGRKNPDNPADWEATEPKNDVDRADEDEVAEGIDEYENNAAILKQLETRLSEVDVALLQIEKGAYGTCKICGEKIEEDRLEANPAAQTCKLHMNE